MSELDHFELENDAHARRWLATFIGAMMQVGTTGHRRDERGLSQSTENAVLLTGAVALALVVLGIVGAFVRSKLGELK